MELLNTSFVSKYILFFLYFSALNIVVYSEKSENISDCRVNDGMSFGPFIRTLTFICGKDNNEAEIFSKQRNFVCGNIGWIYQTSEKIQFENCRFNEINPTLLGNLKDSIIFNISNVQLKNIDADIFRNITELKELYLSNNQLIEIPRFQFANENPLKRIDLSNNHIKRMDPLAFADAKNLEALDLSFNALTVLHAEMFESLPRIVYFNASNNRIIEMDFHILPKSLIAMDLSFNLLTAFEPCNHLVDLVILDLSYNLITNINVDSFAYLTKLEHLNLRQTNLSHIDLGTFSYQQRLISLDLSENNLKALDFKLFFPIMHDLKTLHIADNQLTELKDFRNSLFPQLTLLDINNNNFNCSYLESFMEAVDWANLRLSIESLANPFESNIKGIKCKANDGQQFLSDNDASKYRSKVLQTILDEVSIIKIAMFFMCIAIYVCVIVFLSRNGREIYMKLCITARMCSRKAKKSTDEQGTEFSNDIHVVK